METPPLDLCVNQRKSSNVSVKALALFFQEKSSSTGSTQTSDKSSNLPSKTTSSSLKKSHAITRCAQRNHEENPYSIQDPHDTANIVHHHSIHCKEEESRRGQSSQEESRNNFFPDQKSVLESKEKIHSGCPSGLSMSIPTPKPRLSLLRKQVDQQRKEGASGTCIVNNNQEDNTSVETQRKSLLTTSLSHTNGLREETTTSCLLEAQDDGDDDGYEVSRSPGDNNNFYNEEDDNSQDDDYDDELDDIYEELPAEYHDIRLGSSSKSLDCMTSKRQAHKSSLSFFTGKVLSAGRSRFQNSPLKFLPSFPSRTVKEIAKPPSVDQLNRSLGVLSLQAASCHNLTSTVKQDDAYYDVRELGSDGTGGGGAASDEYYEGIESEELYENVYNSGSDISEGTYESLPGGDLNDTISEEIPEEKPPPLPQSSRPRLSVNSLDRVEYVEIDPKKTAELERKIAKEQIALEKRQKEQADKLRKKFHLTGQEVPVNHGVVKEDARRTRYKIKVKKDEVVLILRMENNPPGLWLAKNERNEVGFVELANISCDAETVKTLMLTNAAEYGCL